MLWDEKKEQYVVQRISERGLKWLRSFEDCRLKAYLDIAGVWTIGWGHTKGVVPGMTITQADADRLFADDVKNISERYVNALPPYVVLKQYQYDALCFLVFNTGPAAIGKRSTIRNALCSGDFEAAADGFLLWKYVTDKNTGKKVVSKALLDRRKLERAYFKGQYEND